MAKLSTQPYRGARDFYPESQKLQNYIFETWRKVCLAYGFEEYGGPFLEPLEIYEAKSGEELVKEQLYRFEDRGGRKVAIRPEMTPTVARMVAAKSKSMTKPIKWFSVANFWRYEKPQRGRLREFFQLNADILGEESVLADFEVYCLGAQIMKELGATSTMYEIRVSDRAFMDFLLEKIVGLSPTQKQLVMKAVDRKSKISEEEFFELLQKKAKVGSPQANKLLEILDFDLEKVKKYQNENLGASRLIEFFKLASSSEFKDVFVFDCQVVRGLDYYTGLVIEQWDKNPKNRRAMYGGGRYDNLTDLFQGAVDLPATGFAMGDVTLTNFLETWKLLPKFENATKVLVTILPNFTNQALILASKLRVGGINCETYSNEKDALDKQLKYADKKAIPFAVIFGEKEAAEKRITVKNLKTREQKMISLGELMTIGLTY